MPQAGTTVRVQLDKDDPDVTVDLNVVDELITTEESGVNFVRRKYKFNNFDESSRTVAIREITHKKRLDDDDDDDEDQKLKVEVILKAETIEGSGPSFRRRKYRLNWDREENKRTTHIKRIKNKDDEDIWIDVRRKDQFITLEQSGFLFKRRLTSVCWGDEEDDNDFDSAICPLVVLDPEKPVRIDFVQDIENINNPASDILVLIVSRSYSTQDDLDLDGNVKLSVTTTKHKPPPDQAQLLYPPIVDANVDVAYQKRIPDPPPPAPPLTTVPIVDPMSGGMKGKLLAWTRGAAVGSGQIHNEPVEGQFLGNGVFDEKRIALFINIKKLFPTKSEEVGAHGDVMLKFPGFNEPAYLYRIEWTVPPTAHPSLLAIQPAGDYFQFVNGTDADTQFNLDQLAAFGATDIKILDVINVVQDEWPVTVAERHHVPGGITLPSSAISLNEYFVPASWNVLAYTFRKNKFFPLDPKNNLDTAALAARAPPVTAEHFGSAGSSPGYSAPLAAATLRVRVKFPDLDLEFSTI